VSIARIASEVAPRPRRHRRRAHGRDPVAVEHADRRALESAGWRTLLEYRENHVRSEDGTLVAIRPRWTGEAELDLGGRPGGRTGRRVLVATATAADPTAVWADLRRQATELASRAFGSGPT
jgi:hypothetical protein